MSIYEYDAEKHLRMEREDAMAEGIAKGKAEVIAEELEEDISTIKKIIEEISK